MPKEKLLEQAEIAPTVNLIDHVKIEIEALLGSTSITISELNALVAGDVLTLDRQINEPVAIRVNDRIIGRGQIVTVNDRFAVRITEVGSI